MTKYFSDGDVHKYFNPYDSPYDSYIIFMNVLDNLNKRCDEAINKVSQKSKKISKVKNQTHSFCFSERG